MSSTRYELAGGVATITLDRPDNRNALGAELLGALAADLARAGTEPSCRVVVLTNSGPVFSAGADLKEGAAPEGLAGLLEALLTLEKPVVGRIAGHCYGGGVGLAAACDISLASDEATFGFSEVRLGVAPAVISVVCLPKMRVADALELFLTGERFTAARAAEVGLLNRAVPASELDAAVGAVISSLMKGAPGALSVAKALVSTVGSLPREEAFGHMTALSASLFESDEAREGREAFAARRPPSWSEESGR